MKTDILKQFVTSRDFLLKEKAALEARLAQIDKALGSEPANFAAPAPAPAPAPALKPSSSKPAKTATGRAKRAKNSMTMREAVIQALTGKSLSHQDLVATLKANGYKFASKDPVNSVSVLLYSDKKTFKNNDGKFTVAK